MIDAQRARPSASASSVALPSFSSPWAMQHLQPTPAPKPMVAPQAPSGDSGSRVLYAMIAALSISVASLGAYVVLRPPPTLLVETTPAAAIIDPTPAEDEPEPESVAAAASDEQDEEDEEPSEEAEEPSEEAEASTTYKPNRHKPNRHKPKDKVKDKTKDRDQPEDKGSVSVECIINPDKCSRKKPPKPNSETAGSTKDLPATPSPSQIRTAMAPVKPTAKACGPRHGGSSGDRVRVKLSAAGRTGKIISAKALEGHAGTALGRCVANALKGATLPRFSKERAGIVYAVRL